MVLQLNGSPGTPISSLLPQLEGVSEGDLRPHPKAELRSPDQLCPGGVSGALSHLWGHLIAHTGLGPGASPAAGFLPGHTLRGRWASWPSWNAGPSPAGQPSGFHRPADFKGSLLTTSSSVAACREELGQSELPPCPSQAREACVGVPQTAPPT